MSAVSKMRLTVLAVGAALAMSALVPAIATASTPVTVTTAASSHSQSSIGGYDVMWDGFALVDESRQTWDCNYDNPRIGFHEFTFKAHPSVYEEANAAEMARAWYQEMEDLGYRFTSKLTTFPPNDTIHYKATWTKTTKNDPALEYFGNVSIDFSTAGGNAAEPFVIVVDGHGHPRPVQ